MIRALINEFKTTPLAALGALAGILSFAVALLAAAPPATGSVGAAQSSSVLSIVQVALVVPATAFFFAFVAGASFHAGLFRAIFLTVVAYIICASLVGGVTGAILSPFGMVPQVDGFVTHEFVLGIHLSALSFCVNFVVLLVFVGVVGEAVARSHEQLLARINQSYPANVGSKRSAAVTKARNTEMDAAAENWSNAAIFLLLGVGPACLLGGWLIAHVTMRATLQI